MEQELAYSFHLGSDKNKIQETATTRVEQIIKQLKEKSNLTE